MLIKSIKRGLPLITILVLLIIIIAACSENESPVTPQTQDEGYYNITVAYDSIRSYPGGGGVFLLGITPEDDFEGDVEISVNADNKLNAYASRVKLTKKDTVVEIILKPEKDIEISARSIEVSFLHKDSLRKIMLYVQLFNWGAESEYTAAKAKMNEFKGWIAENMPDFEDAFSEDAFIYHTYPEMLIVEHYTFLNDDYEVRLCYHVMIPPHDWSYLRVRKRNCMMPDIALKRESSGTINEIDYEEYPVLFNY